MEESHLSSQVSCGSYLLNKVAAVVMNRWRGEGGGQLQKRARQKSDTANQKKKKQQIKTKSLHNKTPKRITSEEITINKF